MALGLSAAHDRVDPVGRRAGLRFARGKIHYEQVLFPLDGKEAAFCLKIDASRRLLAVLENRKGTGKRGVSAEIDLDLGGKPAQVIALAGLDKKSGFRQVVLRCNRLENRIGQPGIEKAYARRVAAEHAAGKGIDLEEGYFHDILDYERLLPLRFRPWAAPV